MTDQQLSSDPDKDPLKPSKVDHGERPDYLLERDKVAAETAKDPGGSTPAQARPDAAGHDDAFADVEPRPVAGFAPDAVENETVEDPQVGGTLPPA